MVAEEEAEAVTEEAAEAVADELARANVAEAFDAPVDGPAEEAGSSLPADGSTAGAVTSPDRAGHERMVRALQRVLDRTPDRNPYVGDGTARRLRRQLEAVRQGGGAKAPGRFQQPRHTLSNSCRKLAAATALSLKRPLSVTWWPLRLARAAGSQP